eukprot:ctg_2207.g429
MVSAVVDRATGVSRSNVSNDSTDALPLDADGAAATYRSHDTQRKRNRVAGAEVEAGDTVEKGVSWRTGTPPGARQSSTREVHPAAVTDADADTRKRDSSSGGGFSEGKDSRVPLMSETRGRSIKDEEGAEAVVRWHVWTSGEGVIHEAAMAPQCSMQVLHKNDRDALLDGSQSRARSTRETMHIVPAPPHTVR